MSPCATPENRWGPNIEGVEPAANDARRNFLTYCRDLAGLEPSGRVLDIGCGRGFLPEALWDYLDGDAHYNGFDTVTENIEHCRREFASRSPSYRFERVDLFNRNYNPDGLLEAASYRLPFADGLFDLVVLRSVFTHMWPSAIENYFSEIARVLAPGRCCLITFFLLNDESLHRMEMEYGVRIRFPYAHDQGLFRTKEPDKSGGVAYREDYVRDLFHRYRLRMREPYYGFWCGRPSEWTSQDMVIATKI